MQQMKRLTFEEFKKRSENIRFCEENAKNYRFRHRVRDYIPGQVFYHMGEYPVNSSFTPTEYDQKVLKELGDRGVGLIQIHSEWTDTERMLGTDKFTTYDPEGIKAFINLVHDCNLKIIPYFSSNYFEMKDPDYVPEMNNPRAKPLVEFYYQLAHCSSASPEWLSYMIPRVEKILDDFDFDGLFNDSGCTDLYLDNITRAHAEDMLYRLYNMVKVRGKIMRLHYSGDLGIPLDEKVYDYLSVGEAVRTYDRVGAYEGFVLSRDHKPYVLPMVDGRFINEDDADEQFANFIPFMQFPELKYGRPYTGIAYEKFGHMFPNEPVTNQIKKLYDYYNANPEGPYAYTEWSSIPDNPKMKETWFKYLDLYKPMVEEGSVCHIDITETPLVKSKYDKNIIVSLFTNEELYMVVSNLSKEPYELNLSQVWTNRETGETKDTYIIEPNRMVFLKK